MGGKNPYITEPDVSAPQQKYRVTFLPMNHTVDVSPQESADSPEGLPGSILDTALRNGIDIDHACGGVCACSTCHVVIREGKETINEATEAEEDMLENAPAVKPTSRLACQAVPDGTGDIIVQIPDWNRNLVKEAHD